jgi:hypothetical protein
VSDTKICHECNESKSASEFYKDESRLDGLSFTCRACTKITRAKFYQQNKERLVKCKRQYRVTHRQEVHQSRLKYYQNNRDKIIKQKIEYEARRKAVDPLFKLIHNLRRRVRRAVNGNYKAGRTLELLGCTPEALKNWLSYQFEEGMNWSNSGKWHIDHVIPCASFNMEDPEEQKKCFHWTNLQPLWAVDNLRKGAKYEQL